MFDFVRSQKKSGMSFFMRETHHHKTRANKRHSPAKGHTMPWIELIAAGLFEFIWASAMKMSEGFTKLGWTLATFATMAASVGLLALATKHLSLSLAYPIWTGIGAVGSVLIGALVFKDRIAPMTWVFIALLLVAIIGIKMTSSE
jgi:quaternary ammonium compound-resistance protein SugE